jgi:PIN domain nuclease of toxin-antitoxin system
MRILIDTHTFLWFIDDHPALSTTARSSIEDENNDVLLSIASIWEMAIKISLGRLKLNGSFEPYIAEQLRLNHITLLPITLQHIAAIATLPFHHKDPFDRLIIAQGLIEKIPNIGIDAAFDAYPITRLW